MRSEVPEHGSPAAGGPATQGSLQDDYSVAWQEWFASDSATAWDAVTRDGLTPGKR